MHIVHRHQLPEVGVTHNPDIKKRVVLGSGQIPGITTFAFATFLPGQSVEIHTHPTMYEVFYIETGKAVFQINGTDLEVKAGDSIVIEPGESHAQKNPYEEPVTWLYFGVASNPL